VLVVALVLIIESIKKYRQCRCGILEREEVFGWKREAGSGKREALQTGRLYRTAD